LAFVVRLLNPKRYNSEDEFERDRTTINEKLVYEGIEIDKTGQPRLVVNIPTKVHHGFRTKVHQI
jgi:hypothetical protein